MRRAARGWDPENIPPHVADPLPADTKVQWQGRATAQLCGWSSACVDRRNSERAVLGQQPVAVAREFDVLRTEVDPGGGGEGPA